MLDKLTQSTTCISKWPLIYTKAAPAANHIPPSGHMTNLKQTDDQPPVKYCDHTLIHRGTI